MTAALAPFVLDMKRLPRASGESLGRAVEDDAMAAFAAALAEASGGAIEADGEFPARAEAEPHVPQPARRAERKQPREPGAHLPMPHFLLAAHHLAVAQRIAAVSATEDPPEPLAALVPKLQFLKEEEPFRRDAALFVQDEAAPVPVHQLGFAVSTSVAEPAPGSVEKVEPPARPLQLRDDILHNAPLPALPCDQTPAPALTRELPRPAVIGGPRGDYPVLDVAGTHSLSPEGEADGVKIELIKTGHLEPAPVEPQRPLDFTPRIVFASPGAGLPLRLPEHEVGVAKIEMIETRHIEPVLAEPHRARDITPKIAMPPPQPMQTAEDVAPVAWVSPEDAEAVAPNPKLMAREIPKASARPAPHDESSAGTIGGGHEALPPAGGEEEIVIAPQLAPNSKIATTTVQPRRDLDNTPQEAPVKLVRASEGEDSAPEAVAAVEHHDVAVPLNLAAPRPQPALPATQVIERLAPEIDQARAILRILERAGSQGPVVRTLQFGLSPEELGDVRVTLSLADEKLDLRIETQTEEAARRLELDRELLDTLLTQAGASPDRGQIDIRMGRFEPAQPAALFEGAGPRGGGEQAGTFQQSERRPGGSPSAHKDHSDVSGHRTAPDQRDHNGVYL